MDGKLIKLGLCQRSLSKAIKTPTYQDNNTTKGFEGKCSVNPKAFISKLPASVAGNRDFNIKADRVYSKNYLSTLKLGGAKFRFKSNKPVSGSMGHLVNLKGKNYSNVHENNMSNSSLTIPPYSNSTLNGKGHSFNTLPHERFDNSADSLL